MSEISVDSSASGDSGVSGNVQITLNEDRISSLRQAGYTDAQIESLLSMADPDDQGNSLTPRHFYSVNKQTLNALRYTGQLDESTKELVYLQAPMALVQEVSDPSNWDGDTYNGPAASEINAYLLGKPVDFTKPSLDALIMSVLTARADILQVQLEDQIESISEKNTRLEEANDMLARAKDLKAKAGDDGSRPMTQEMIKFWDAWGAKRADGENDYDSAEWDANIEGLKSKIEKLTSQSQLETTKLQQTINKYNQTFEMLSNFINKYYQSISTIIQNLR